MTQEELNQLLELHKKWLNKEEGGKRVDFYGQKFVDLDFSNADLTSSNLSHANFFYCDFDGTIFMSADMDFSSFNHSTFRNSDFTNATIVRSVFLRCDFKDALFRCTCLGKSFFGDSNLYNAKIEFCDLYELDMSHALNVPELPMDVPDGEFIGYKKINDMYIVKLKILEDSKRSCGTSYKYRCDKALVLQIQNIDGSDSGLNEIENNGFYYATYKVGEIVYADSFDKNRWNECSHGIHFFLSRQRAVEYFTPMIKIKIEEHEKGESN